MDIGYNTLMGIRYNILIFFKNRLPVKKKAKKNLKFQTCILKYLFFYLLPGRPAGYRGRNPGSTPQRLGRTPECWR